MFVSIGLILDIDPATLRAQVVQRIRVMSEDELALWDGDTEVLPNLYGPGKPPPLPLWVRSGLILYYTNPSNYGDDHARAMLEEEHNIEFLLTNRDLTPLHWGGVDQDPNFVPTRPEVALMVYEDNDPTQVTNHYEPIRVTGLTTPRGPTFRIPAAQFGVVHECLTSNIRPRRNRASGRGLESEDAAEESSHGPAVTLLSALTHAGIVSDIKIVGDALKQGVQVYLHSQGVIFRDIPSTIIASLAKNMLGDHQPLRQVLNKDPTKLAIAQSTLALFRNFFAHHGDSGNTDNDIRYFLEAAHGKGRMAVAAFSARDDSEYRCIGLATYGPADGATNTGEVYSVCLESEHKFNMVLLAALARLAGRKQRGTRMFNSVVINTEDLTGNAKVWRENCLRRLGFITSGRGRNSSNNFVLGDSGDTRWPAIIARSVPWLQDPLTCPVRSKSGRTYCT